MKFYLVKLLIFITVVIVLVNAVPTPIAKSKSTSNSTSPSKHKSTKKPNSTPKSNNTPPVSNSNSTSSCFQKDNADKASALQAKFASLTPTSPCKNGDMACVNGAFAQCVGDNNWVLQKCSNGLECRALPLVNKPGTSIACDSKSDADARIQAAKNACK
ncbi:9062_t:CDS:2 [Gigaspora margarita]|uniref:9062_t:CDS:1 n=1 Tax=Gigaspora margarita TaxID=4874 RepID=A0ABN7V8Y1_GIGMA|nr:9062_t:CDS:2 [Gigaspora margarita]